MRHILFCAHCQKYTLQEQCTCGNKTIERKPPKYSPEDKYGHYRREVLAPERKEKGLL